MRQAFRPGRCIRRALALTTAAVTLWLLLPGESSSEQPTEEPFTAVLAAQPQPLPFWQRLAVCQSPLLAANLLHPPAPTTSEAPAPSPSSPRPEEPKLEQSHTPPSPVPSAGIVERTLVPASSQGYVTAGGIYLYNRSGLEADLATALQTPLKLDPAPADQGPQILILHTHSTEAYCPTQEDPYVPTDANSRTLDQQHSVIRVGEEAKQVFEEMGFSVLHDRGIYDYPQYDGSYGRSGEAAARLLAQYPTIRLVLDIHRDALVAQDGTIYKTVTTIDGKKTAQVMLVVGSDGLGSHPNWRDNLALAARIQRSLDTLYPTLARPITLRKAGYNQALHPGSLLVEVGTHGNTLEEALAAVRLFARSAGSVLLGEMKG